MIINITQGNVPDRNTEKPFVAEISLQVKYGHSGK